MGSFLRPKILDEAKQAYANGIVDKEYLTKVEDGAILDFVSKQEKVGLKCVGDGEFRRNYWHMDFFWALDGIEKIYDESVPRSEFSDHYVIMPSIKFYDKQANFAINKLGEKGYSVSSEFEYRSDNNTQWLDGKSLKEMMEKI